MAEKMQAVCKCGYLLETRPFTKSTISKTVVCRNCKKQVNIQYSNGMVYVSYKG